MTMTPDPRSFQAGKPETPGADAAAYLSTLPASRRQELEREWSGDCPTAIQAARQHIHNMTAERLAELELEWSSEPAGGEYHG